MYSTRMQDLKITKLSDEFGQYTLIPKCESCLRERRTTPNMIAHIVGWTRGWRMSRDECAAQRAARNSAVREQCRSRRRAGTKVTRTWAAVPEQKLSATALNCLSTQRRPVLG